MDTDTRQRAQTGEEYYQDHEEVLHEYRQRQMIEHITGPMVSLLLHCVVVIACAILLVGREVREENPFVLNTREMQFKPLDPKVLEDPDLETDPIDDTVPKIEKPEIRPDPMEVETPDFSEAMAEFEFEVELPPLQIKKNHSPIAMPPSYGNRTEEGRRKALKKHVGSGLAGPTEQAIMRALRWLKDHQEKDGSWSPNQYREGMTGLALLALLAHGETTRSEEFGMTVQTAMQWLANNMLNKGGKLEHKGYSHGIATYALSEAYGMTKMPFLRPAMETGLTRIVQGQQPGGGFNYNYAKAERWDLSVSAWQIQALKAGYIANAKVAGLEEAILKSADFVKRTAYSGGKFGYCSPGAGRPAMTAAGTLALQLLGEGDCLEVKSALEGLRELQGQWKGNDFAHGATYGWYYAAQAKFHAGLSLFKKWHGSFAPMLIANQAKDGHWPSPEGDSHSGSEMEPYYNTAMNALSLQVPYRLLPTYEEQTRLARVENDVFGFEEDL